MMLYPSVNKLMKRSDSKYSLVIATAKRAREICQTGITFTECDCDKPVSIAVNEINENKVTFKSNHADKEQSTEDFMNMILEDEFDL